MPEKNQNFPNALEAFFLVIALYMAEYLFSVAAYDFRDVLAMDPVDVGCIVMVLACGLIFTFLMQYKSLTYRELFHPSSSSMGATLLVLLPALALTIPAIVLAISSLMQAVVWLFPLSAAEESMFALMGSGSLAAIVYGCILAPVLEEMLFRGIILRSFLSQYTKWSAIIGSATLFGFAHLNIYQYIVGLLMGIFLGWLYERSKSLLPCIALHAAYNTTLMAMSMSTSANEAQFDGGYWFTAILLALAGASVLRRVLHAPAGTR